VVRSTATPCRVFASVFSFIPSHESLRPVPRSLCFPLSFSNPSRELFYIEVRFFFTLPFRGLSDWRPQFPQSPRRRGPPDSSLPFEGYFDTVVVFLFLAENASCYPLTSALGPCNPLTLPGSLWCFVNRKLRVSGVASGGPMKTFVSAASVPFHRSLVAPAPGLLRLCFQITGIGTCFLFLAASAKDFFSFLLLMLAAPLTSSLVLTVIGPTGHYAGFFVSGSFCSLFMSSPTGSSKALRVIVAPPAYVCRTLAVSGLLMHNFSQSFTIAAFLFCGRII